MSGKLVDSPESNRINSTPSFTVVKLAVNGNSSNASLKKVQSSVSSSASNNLSFISPLIELFVLS